MNHLTICIIIFLFQIFDGQCIVSVADMDNIPNKLLRILLRRQLKNILFLQKKYLCITTIMVFPNVFVETITISCIFQINNLNPSICMIGNCFDFI